MFKELYMRLITGLIICIPMLIFSQETQQMDHGSSDIQWRIIGVDGVAQAFALSRTHIWYSNGNTVGTFDLRTNKKRLYPQLGEMPSTGIKTIAVDNKGNVWLGGANGLARGIKNKFTVFTKDKGIADNKVNHIFVGLGSVWVGTENGLSQYQGSTWKNYTTNEGLCGNAVRGITMDDNSKLYCATDKGIATFKGGKWNKFDASNGLSSNNVKAIAYDDRKGELWAAVGEQDVNSYNGKKWNTYMDIQPDVTSIMVDTQSRIWFGSMSGIVKYNGFEWVTDPAKIGFPAAQVVQMFRDKKGDLYFAIESGILHMKNPYPY